MTSHGRTRYARQSWVVVDIFTKLLRQLAYETIQPTILHFQLNRSNFERMLLPSEREMFNALTSTDGYDICDTAFLLKLLFRSSRFPPPSTELNNPPAEGTFTVSDDLQRIRDARNALAHRINTNVSEEEHDDFFRIFTAVAERFDNNYLRQTPDISYREKIEEVRTCDIEPEREDHIVREAEDIERIELKLTEVCNDVTCKLYHGESFSGTLSNLEWEGFNQTKIALIITSSNMEFTEEQLESIRRLKEAFNRQSVLIQIVDVREGSIVVRLNVCLFRLKSIEVLSSEVMKLIHQIVERLKSRRLRNIEAILVSADTYSELDESMILPFYDDEGREAIQFNNDDLVLTTKTNGAHQQTKSQETSSGVKSIIENVRINTSELNVIVYHNLPKLSEAQVALYPKKSSYTTRLRQKYNAYMPVHGCALVGTTIVLASNAQKNLVLIDTVVGSKRTIPLAGKGYFVSVINSTTVAVTLLNESIVQILDLETGNVVNQIGINKMIHNICYHKGEFFVKLVKEIEVIDLNGSVLRTVPVHNGITGFAVNKNRLYYATTDTLYCCNLFGEEIWRFSDEALPSMAKLTTDENGNVFLIGTSGCNVVMVTSDGQYQTELITEMDNIITMCCDSRCDLYVIVDIVGTVFLYDVIKPKEV